MTILNPELEILVLDDIEEQEKVEKPSLYKLVVVDDETSTMQLVIDVFEQFFGKSPDDAWNCMMEVHQKGSSVGGVFTKDIAETKIDQINNFKGEYPLRIAKVKQ